MRYYHSHAFGSPKANLHSSMLCKDRKNCFPQQGIWEKVVLSVTWPKANGIAKISKNFQVRVNLKDYLLNHLIRDGETDVQRI